MSFLIVEFLNRAAPLVTALALFLNSVGGLFGLAPAIPYNPERTDIVISGNYEWDIEEILGYYNAAVKKTNSGLVMGTVTKEISIEPKYILEGEETEKVKEFLGTFCDSQSAIYKIPGDGEILPSDVERAKMTVEDGKRTIILHVKYYTVAGDNTIGRAYGIKNGVTERLNERPYTDVNGTFSESFGLPENINGYSVISCVIDDRSGKIIYGDWDFQHRLYMWSTTVTYKGEEIRFKEFSCATRVSVDI